MSDLDSRLVAVAPGLAAINYPDHAVVLNLPRIEQQQSPYLFEGTAFEVWVRIDGKRSSRQIVSLLQELADDSSRDRIEADTLQFLAQLEELGLVERK